MRRPPPGPTQGMQPLADEAARRSPWVVLPVRGVGGVDQVIGEPVRGERVAFGRVVVEGVLAVGPDSQRRGGGVGGAEERLLVLVAGERVVAAVQEEQRAADAV